MEPGPHFTVGENGGIVLSGGGEVTDQAEPAGDLGVFPVLP